MHRSSVAIVVSATRTSYTVEVDGMLPSKVTLPSPLGPFERETVSFGVVTFDATAPDPPHIRRPRPARSHACRPAVS